MAQYIDLEALVDWLKRIPLKDLSDGQGLCRVIMEDDFKAAIKSLPDSAVVDMAPVVRCRDCIFGRAPEGDEKRLFCRGVVLCEFYESDIEGKRLPVWDDNFCSHGYRKGGPNGGDSD